MSGVLLRGGTLLDADGQIEGCDVLVRGGAVAAVGASAAEDAAGGDVEVIDVRGCHVVPGFVDLHVHLREPGGEEAETVASGTRAAAAGGFTAVVAMPNTTPATDGVAMVERVRATGDGAACDVAVAAAITRGRAGEELVDLEALHAAGVRIFTDDGDVVADTQLMREALERVAVLDGAVLGQHSEDPHLVAGGHVHEGAVSAALGLRGRPGVAEEAIVARDLAVLRRHGGRLHVLHASDARAVDLVRRAKAEGLPVTCEVTPHHLVLTDEAVRDRGAAAKVNPPLRTDGDVAAMRAALRDGTIDAIATDHAPHPAERKTGPLADCSPGLVGLETAFALAHTHLVATGEVPLATVVAALSWRPAAIAGLTGHGRRIEAGEPANLAVLDTSASWTYRASDGESRSHNTPFDGATLTGRVRHTLLRGHFTLRDHRLVQTGVDQPGVVA